MLYGEHYGDNKLILINPQGKVEYEYRKTKTIYDTESDGIIRFAITPFGRIGAAMIFPNERSLLRLVGAILIEVDEQWQGGKRYLPAESD